jgi:two-component system, OmpR family, phosphate regulon response regulator PhoB
MHSQTTVLIPLDKAFLIGEIDRRRPDWNVMPLDAAVRDPGLAGPCWAFIDWIGASMSGIELCRQLREARPTRAAHITIVLDSGDSEERRRAMKAGADDYMTGPLDARAVLDRMALYEAAGAAQSAPRARVENGDLCIDLAAHQLRYRGTPIPLRPNEFRLLAHFMEHPNQVFSRIALIERLGKDEEAIDERTVDVWVGRLRRALAAHGAPDPLRTVRALGYVMDSVES